MLTCAQAYQILECCYALTYFPHDGGILPHIFLTRDNEIGSAQCIVYYTGKAAKAWSRGLVSPCQVGLHTLKRGHKMSSEQNETETTSVAVFYVDFNPF